MGEIGEGSGGVVGEERSWRGSRENERFREDGIEDESAGIHAAELGRKRVRSSIISYQKDLSDQF